MSLHINVRPYLYQNSNQSHLFLKKVSNSYNIFPYLHYEKNFLRFKIKIIAIGIDFGSRFFSKTVKSNIFEYMLENPRSLCSISSLEEVVLVEYEQILLIFESFLNSYFQSCLFLFKNWLNLLFSTLIF